MKCHLAVLAHVVSPSVLAREHTPPPFAQRETLRIPRCIFFTVILLMRETVSRDQLWSRTSHTKSPSNYTERPLLTPHDPENPMTRSVGLQRSTRSGSESLLLSELLIYQKKKLRIKWTHDPFWTCRSSQTLNMFVSFVYPLCLFSTKWSLKLNRKQLCRQQCQHAHLCFGFSACRSQGSCFVQLCFPLQTVIFCVVWTRHVREIITKSMWPMPEPTDKKSAGVCCRVCFLTALTWRTFAATPELKSIQRQTS